MQTTPSLVGGKYQIVRQLGEGGMGAVYEGRHTGTGRRVAVKVIAGAALAKNAEVVSRFQREAMASGAIESQYIAQILDTGVDEATGNPYTVMELLSGEDLSQAVQRLGPLAPDVALRVVAQACLGLKKAHEAGVVHRDIKPANLYLAKREEGDVVVKLLDFGIAKVRAEPGSVAEVGALTRTGAMLGSPLYMSPEQARGLKDIDHRTDIWSLGVVLYEALAGATPNADVDTVGELILRICSAPPRHLQEVAPWVPPAAAEIVHRALTLEPSGRFGTAAEMLDAIRAQLPTGLVLSESMFTAMSPQARAAVAPKLELSSGMRAPSPSFAGLPERLSRPTAPAASGASTTVGVQTSTGAEGAKKKSRTATVVAIAVAMAAVGGLAAWKLAPRPTSSSASTPATTTIAAPPTPPPAPPPSVVTLAPPDRTVLVAVSPATVSAQVDGADASVDAGAVAVTGSLGSVHHVQLTAGRSTQTFDVTITDVGPMPARLELPAAKPGTASAPVAPRPTAAPSPAPAPAPTTTSAMHMDLK